MKQHLDNLETLREKLAAIEHEGWSAWQRDLHAQCAVGKDGALTIPAKLVVQLERQMNTKYQDLPEDEKESDRQQVDRYLQFVQERPE